MRSLTLKLLMILTMVISLVAFSGCTGNDVDIDDGIQDQVEDETPPNHTPPSNDIPPQPAKTDDGEYIYGTAVVENIEILTLESFPVRINVITKGYLPDGCTEIGDITKSKDGNTFVVNIETIRPADVMCTQAIVPYEEVIPLDVYGIKAGTYSVVVNDVRGSFELATDNSLPDTYDSVETEYMEVNKGDNFTVRLDENPTTGYAWSIETSDGLVVLSDKYIPPQDEGLIGAGNVHVWEIQAVETGTQQINGIYKRSWENVTGDEQKYELTVNVT